MRPTPDPEELELEGEVIGENDGAGSEWYFLLLLVLKEGSMSRTTLLLGEVFEEEEREEGLWRCGGW